MTPELAGRIDALSISLNGSTSEKYMAVTCPKDGEKAWEAMLDFTRRAAKYVPRVMMTVVDNGLPEEEIEACRSLAQSLGATLRVRQYISE